MRIAWNYLPTQEYSLHPDYSVFGIGNPNPNLHLWLASRVVGCTVDPKYSTHQDPELSQLATFATFIEVKKRQVTVEREPPQAPKKRRRWFSVPIWWKQKRRRMVKYGDEQVDKGTRAKGECECILFSSWFETMVETIWKCWEHRHGAGSLKHFNGWDLYVAIHHNLRHSWTSSVFSCFKQ